MPGISLRQWLGAIPLERFLAEYWNKKWIHVPGAAADKFHGLLGPDDVDAILASSQTLRINSIVDPPGKVVIRAAFSASQWKNNPRTTQPQICLAPEQVAGALATGVTIELQGLEHLRPNIAEAARSIKNELSYTGRIVCSFWLSTALTGANAAHFDPSSVLVCQLTGRKRWKLGAHRALEHPVQCGFLVNQTTPQEVAYSGTHQEWELENRPVDEWCDVVMQPGDMLFVPSGMYHETTEMDGDRSIALHFHFQRATCVDLFQLVMQERFMCLPEWRDVPACVVDDDGRPPREFAEYLRRRIEELSGFVDALREDATPVLAEWHKGAASRSTRTPDAAMDRETALALGHTVRWLRLENEIRLFADDVEVIFDEPRLLPFARGLIQFRTGFRVRDALVWTEGKAPWGEIQEMLSILVQKGILFLSEGGLVARHECA